MSLGTAAARLAPQLAKLAHAAGTDESAVALAWLMNHPVKVMPVMGRIDVSRIQKFADAEKVPMDRQTWFELYECANGCEVP
jgi:predicted oxidoreductase